MADNSWPTIWLIKAADTGRVHALDCRPVNTGLCVCQASGSQRIDQGSIMPRMAKYSMAAIVAEAGTVMTQAAAILISCERFTSSCL